MDGTDAAVNLVTGRFLNNHKATTLYKCPQEAQKGTEKKQQRKHRSLLIGTRDNAVYISSIFVG